MTSANPKYPLATIVAFGPTDKLATKLVATIVPWTGSQPSVMRKWLTTNTDIRDDATIRDELVAFVQQHAVVHALTPETIMGCPHEEGIDFPRGASCPHCPFWAGRPRLQSVLPPAPGRNAPCPCKSGKKFKKCCGAVEIVREIG